MLVKDYEYNLSRRDELERKISEIVLESKAMLALMQLSGIYQIAAFATQVIVEDARRFPSASKLAAYGGFAMIGNTSGEECRLEMHRTLNTDSCLLSPSLRVEARGSDPERGPNAGVSKNQTWDGSESILMASGVV